MSFSNLRSFLDALESRGQLHRIRAEVDPNQEITIIQHRVLDAGGPALLFENLKGCKLRMATNLYGTPERVALAFGAEPEAIGARIGSLMDAAMTRDWAALWNQRRTVLSLPNTRLRRVSTGPILD